MLCTRCQAREASVHVETVVNGRKTSARFCPDCARGSGIELAIGALQSVNFPELTPALAALAGQLSGLRPRSAAAACPSCRWTLADFRRAGKMGCPDCYRHFRSASERIISEVQCGLVHKGRRPSR